WKCTIILNFTDRIEQGTGIGVTKEEALEKAKESAAQQLFNNAIQNNLEEYRPNWFNDGFELIVAAFETERVKNQYKKDNVATIPEHPSNLFKSYFIQYAAGLEKSFYLSLGFGIENFLKGIIYKNTPFQYNQHPWSNGHDL